MLYVNERTKKYIKIMLLILVVLVLAGCGRNLDSDGKLIASRAINESTAWSFDNGIFDFILVIPIAKAIIYLSKITGNVAWGVVLVTILINIIILPLMIKSTVSSQKMQMIQPELEKIQNKYRGRNDQNSQMRQSAEMQELYKKNGISMAASFTSLLTLPIMLAMWQSVQRVEILYSSNFLGLALGATPMTKILAGSWGYIILVVVVGLTQYLAIEINNIMLKRNPKYKQSKTQDSMKTMNLVMTAMIIWFSLEMPSAMSLYWITTSIITILRTVFIQLVYIEGKKK